MRGKNVRMLLVILLMFLFWIWYFNRPATKQQEYSGLLILGHETQYFRDSDSKTEWWIDDRTNGLLKTQYDSLITEPYEAVYAKISGIRKSKRTEGFAADYDGVLEIHTLLDMKRLKPTPSPKD